MLRSARSSSPHGTLRLVVLASITVSFLAGSSAPTPLYATWQRAWGFSELTTTVVFGIYAVALLLTLLSVGRLSDHLGRKPVLLAGIGGQVAALAVFADAHSVAALVVARVVQGLATGTAIGALGAAMLDVDPRRGAIANATAPGLGTGSGALLAALAVQWLPAPAHLSFLVLIAVLLIQAAMVAALPESSPRSGGALRSLLPRIAVPPAARRPLLAAAPVLFAVWALAGFYGSLGPSVIGQLSGSGSVVDGGLGLGLLALVAAAATFLLRSADAVRTMAIGMVALVAGVGLTLLGVRVGSVALFLVATSIAGVGFGAGFSGGMRLVAPLAQPHQRAGLLSIVYTISYLGLGLPAVGAGVAVVHGGGLLPTTYAYGAVLVALTALAAVNLAGLRTRRAPAATAPACHTLTMAQR